MSNPRTMYNTIYFVIQSNLLKKLQFLETFDFGWSKRRFRVSY